MSDSKSIPPHGNPHALRRESVENFQRRMKTVAAYRAEHYAKIVQDITGVPDAGALQAAIAGDLWQRLATDYNNAKPSLDVIAATLASQGITLEDSKEPTSPHDLNHSRTQRAHRLRVAD